MAWEAAGLEELTDTEAAPAGEPAEAAAGRAAEAACAGSGGCKPNRVLCCRSGPAGAHPPAVRPAIR